MKIKSVETKRYTLSLEQSPRGLYTITSTNHYTKDSDVKEMHDLKLALLTFDNTLTELEGQ